ncbi:MAG: FtsX-like permease family protein [Sphaerochaetaceae bacterium]
MKKDEFIFIVKLAFKNMWHYKRRTIITAASIAMGLAMFIIVDSLLIGAEKESENNLRWYETADIVIMETSYFEERLYKDINHTITGSAKIVSRLQENGYRVAPRITFLSEMFFGGVDFDEEGHIATVVTAVKPAPDKEVFKLHSTIVEGRYIEQNSHEAVIGSFLAEDIDAKVGSFITLLFQGKGGFFELIDLEIVGITDCPNPNVNRSLLIVDFNTISDYLETDYEAAEIYVSLSSFSNLNREIQKIEKILETNNNSLKVVGWEELSKDYLAIAKAKRGGSALILVLVFIIAVVGVSNTMLMAIYERTKEVAVIRSFGANDKFIYILFSAESAFVGLLGVLIGLVIAVSANLYMVNIGFDFGYMMREIDIGYRIQSTMHGSWNFLSMVLSSMFCLFFCGLFGALFTRRALKKEISDALRDS